MNPNIKLLLSLVVFFSCEKSLDQDVLATVGSREVTSFEFAGSYSDRLIKSQIQDSKFERDRHFQFLIRNKLFSEAAVRNNLKLDSIANRYIALDSIKFLRDELYYEEILNEKIAIEESDLRKHYVWSKRECHLKHLYFNTQDDADSAYVLLAIDPSRFDTLAFHTFTDEKLKESGGNLGWVSYNVLDPNLEKNGFDMALDGISPPVQSSFGWHILKKLDEKNQMITDEAEFQKVKENIRKTIIQKEQQIRADQFINQLMLSKNILLDDSLIQDVTKALFELAQLNNRQQVPPLQNRGEILKSIITNLRDISHLPLAQYDGGTFFVQDYIDGIQSLPPAQTNYSPKMTFYHALRNKILAEEGGKQELGKHPNVKRKIQDSRDIFLSRAYLATFFEGQTQGRFEKEELDKIADSLRTIIPVKTYPEHLERLFAEG